MTSIHIDSRALAFGAAMLLTAFCGPVFADDMKINPVAKIGDIAVLEAWARATPVKTGGAYLTLRNDGATADRLVDASTDVAEMAHLHQSIKENGVEKMRGVEGIDLPPHATVMLKPGGYHVMLMGLTKPLKAGNLSHSSSHSRRREQARSRSPSRRLVHRVRTISPWATWAT